jgi:hypothetical protein
MKNPNKGGVKVGQTVYSLKAGQRALEKQVVTKVGSKYFYYIGQGREVKISMDTFKDKTSTGICYSVKIYLSPHHFEDEQERSKVFSTLYRELKVYSNHKHWTTVQMKQAMDILGVDYE